MELPEVREGGWYFRQLFVNGVRARRARLPNRGYFGGGAAGPDPDWFTGHRRFRYRTDDLPDLSTPADGEAIVF